VLVRGDHVASIIVNANHCTATEKRFVVRADEKLTAFMELESAIRSASAEISLLRKSAAGPGSQALPR